MFQEAAIELMQLLGLDPEVTIQLILVRDALQRAYNQGLEDGWAGTNKEE